MNRAIAQRKTVYALFKGRLVPKSEVFGNEGEVAPAPSVAASLEPEIEQEETFADEQEIEDDETVAEPKRRGRPPKVADDIAVSEFEIKA